MSGVKHKLWLITDDKKRVFQLEKNFWAEDNPNMCHFLRCTSHLRKSHKIQGCFCQQVMVVNMQAKNIDLPAQGKEALMKKSEQIIEDRLH